MDDVDKIIKDILNDDDDDCQGTPDKFKVQLELFEKELNSQKLSKKTINKHVTNVAFYLHDFGVYGEHINELKDGCYEINYYLGDWYIEKCTWASKSDCKDQIAGIKKFYKCMLDLGQIEEKHYQFLLDMIKEYKEEWFDTLESYDDWLMGEDNDDGFNWF